ncbi:MAG: POTRA domain-containing protein [Nitrosomonadales bacterium]
MSLEVEQGVLIVLVNERPTIASVDIDGIKAFSKDTLVDSLKGVGLAQGRIFDRSIMDKAEQELKRQYISHGNYSVVVNTKVTQLERNRVGLAINVEEGEASKIKKINIIGNQASVKKSCATI